METFFSVGEAAKLVNMTAETLRHYDRIGLVRPGKTDEWTGYRYYSQQEIVRLHTVRALRCMGLPLAAIKELLSYDDFHKIVASLRQAEANADAKIAELQEAKERIRRARVFYEEKLKGETPAGHTFVKELPQRVLLLSETLEEPTVENLWNYHRHFYGQLPESMREAFAFEDQAGIYVQGGRQRLFAVCTRYAQAKGIVVLPQGRYLCADCAEEDRAQAAERLCRAAREECGADPAFMVQLIVLSGILQWNYQLQVFLPPREEDGAGTPQRGGSAGADTPQTGGSAGAGAP